VHVRTLCLASFLELFLSGEGDGDDDDDEENENDDEENGSSSDDTEDEDGNGRRCSSRRRRAATNNPAQRWLASTALLAGPLLCFCRDMDRALPALRARAAAHSAASAAARAAEEEAAAASAASRAATAGPGRTSGGPAAAAAALGSGVSYAAANHLQSLQYAALQVLFRRCHWRSHDALATRRLPPLASAGPWGGSALRWLPRGLALVVGQYGAAQAQLALRAHPPAHGAPLALYGALAAGAGRSGSLGSGGGGLRSGGADGLEALWAALEAQCARSEDVAHARAATDLLASVSLGLRKADAAGAMATRVLRQPYSRHRSHRC
jgi:hypothetical protein